MGNILVIAETKDGKIKKPTFHSINGGLQLAAKAGGACDLLLLGSGVAAAASELAAYGLRSILVADSPALANYLTETYAKVAADVAKEGGYEGVVVLSTVFGKDIASRVAGILGAAEATEVLEILGPKSVKRPMYAGNIIATVELTTPVVVLTLRGTSFGAAAASGGASEVKTVPVTIDAGSLATKFISFDSTASARPDLTEAEYIVAGGRGMKSAEGFKQLEVLADLLKGAVGASRAAVDAAFCANDLQVGQTGKIVAPKLYFAFGISGAIQHWAGMKDSKVIVAVNKDEEAPIFAGADYGLVADLFTVLPELTAKIKETIGG